MFDGLERTYYIHIPSSHDKTKPMPLVFVLHGAGDSGRKMAWLTRYGFNKLSGRDGFIVVYPDAIGEKWDQENIDDVGFISALIDHLVKKLNIDERRVYVTGMSNGAFMTNLLACELSGKIAAIAPVSGTMAKEFVPYCSPSRPISVLIIHGDKDKIVPWKGGELPVIRLKILSVEETVDHWVTHNNCSSSSIITWEPDRYPQDGTRVRREVYGQGNEGTEVILYAIEGGGHTWPGGHQLLPILAFGRVCKDINACEVIWEFFKGRSIK
jgi:Poly(3-hydroxybutyrate) depolymerase